VALLSTFPGSPRVARAGLVVLDALTGEVQRIVTLQINPDSVTRAVQAKAASGDTQDPGEALRLSGPPTETITLEAELDVTDQLEHPDDNETESSLGLLPRLAALEELLYPPAAQVQQHDALARAGTVEILPIPGPLVVFVWSPNRVVPVRLTELSIVEQAFDTNLRPIRAKVSLSLRVLSVDDLGFATRGGSLAMTHHLSIEQLAARSPSGAFEDLGLGGLP
jgi:hypothetical protein